ncbi:alpha/beta fold hydrolase [Planctomonas psychrotolerans]|uniref:alpha/beta fold hydrolase n=1 Tax=Planctomonas psychrotolerans TaxID=2528712 RepID=UPI0012397463|nr:alpha/beta fold hydrolase [Planctomonas psychrotolerans]
MTGNAEPRTLTDLKPEDAEEFTLDRPEGALSAVRVVSRGDSPESAPVAVLVPGYTGSKEDFYPVLGPIADLGFTVVAFSQRGQYHSEGPHHTEPPTDISGYEVETLGRDVHWVLDTLGLTAPVHLLGHSFGGIVGIEAVLQDPSRFLSFTMWNSGPRSWATRPEVAAALTAGGTDALWRWGNPGAEPENLGRLERWFYDRLRATSSTQLLAAVGILDSQPDRVDEVREAGVPVLVSHGENDDAWPHDWQKDMAERLDAPYVIVPDAGHSPQVDRPEESARVLVSFWRSAAV